MVMVRNVTKAKEIPYSFHMTPHTMVISSTVGMMLNNIKVSRNSMPLVPRSMARLMPPVLRSI